MNVSELQRPVKSYVQAEALLLALVRENPRPYASHAFEGVGLLLEALGNPQRGLPCLHIAGSKGKGSVALMSEALFEAHGIRTATFTSPHLRRWTERFRIGGREIPEHDFVKTLERIRPVLEHVARDKPEDLPSFFDVLCAMALLLFKEAGVQLAVIECGLGGRYDATNVVSPVLCCITSIELEHTDKLGPDRLSIAGHKAGIITSAVPVVTGRLPADAAEVIHQQARQQRAPVYRYAEDFSVVPLRAGATQAADHQRLRYTSQGRKVDFDLPCYGWPMAENAALALYLLELYARDHSAIMVSPADTGRSARALAQLQLPGRGQILSRKPLILVDSAHTGDSLALLGEHLDVLDVRRRRFLISATRGKDLRALARLLHPAEAVICTRADPLRSMPAAELAAGLAGLRPELPLTAIEDPGAALTAARGDLSSDQCLCICGSVYLAGFALDFFKT